MKLFLALTAITSLATSCGGGQAFVASNQKVSGKFGAVAGDSGSKDFNLDASGFVFDVLGCRSGFEKLGNDSTQGNTIAFYKGDENCRIELKSISFDSKSWVPQNGSSTVFMNANDSSDPERLSVSLVEFLPNPIVADFVLSYRLALLNKGDGKKMISYGGATLVDSKTKTKGKPTSYAPNIKIKPVAGVSLTSLDESTKIGSFEVTFECAQAILGGSTCKTTGGTSQAMTNFRVALVRDTFRANISWGDLQSAFDATTNKISVTSSSLVGASNGFNGGFKVTLPTPTDLGLCRDMTAIVEWNAASTNDKAYTYVDIDFASTLVQ